MRQIMRIRQLLQDKSISKNTWMPLWTVKHLTSWKTKKRNKRVDAYVVRCIREYAKVSNLCKTNISIWNIPILERDNFLCRYCWEEISETVHFWIDHIIPATKWWSDKKENLVTCCTFCNSQKSDKIISKEMIDLLHKWHKDEKIRPLSSFWWEVTHNWEFSEHTENFCNDCWTYFRDWTSWTKLKDDKCRECSGNLWPNQIERRKTYPLKKLEP